MKNLDQLAVYCGSAPGTDPAFAEAARATAAAMVREKIQLVYGGGRLGLMGLIADSVLELGGFVYGVIPQALVDIEVAHVNVTELHIVETMHERKALMASLSDAFVALPGGLGTLEEIFEVWTWAQLGIHAKPLGFLDVAGFYGPLMEFLDRAVEAGFIRTQNRATAIVDADSEGLLRRISSYEPPRPEKWIGDAET